MNTEPQLWKELLIERFGPIPVQERFAKPSEKKPKIVGKKKPQRGSR